jgi:hypothetical protein
MGWFDVEPINVLFFSIGSQSVPPDGGLGPTSLTEVLAPCVLATLAAKSYASFSLNCPACVSVAFSHARASRWSDLRMITPFDPDILMVA